MRRRTTLQLFTALAILLAACDDDYESEVPLDPAPQVRNDPRLLGSWRCVVDDADFVEVAAVTFTAASERTYRITFGLSGVDEEQSEAFGSTLKNLTVLNLKSSSSSWFFAEYVFLAPNVLRVRNIAERLLDDVPPSAVRSTIEKQRTNPDLYTDYVTVCVKSARSE